MRPAALARLASAAAATFEGVGRVALGAIGQRSGAHLDRRAGAAVLAALAVLALAPPLAPLAAIAVWAVAAARDRRRRAAARRALVAELAEVVPLLQLAVGGGLTVRASLAAVVPWLVGPLGAELRQALSASSAGTVADELDTLAERTLAPARPLLAALSAADRYGAPLQAPLQQLALDARLAARRLAEEEARQVPVRLLFPLVAGVLPAFVLLTVVPLLASSLGGVQLTGL